MTCGAKRRPGSSAPAPRAAVSTLACRWRSAGFSETPDVGDPGLRPAEEAEAGERQLEARRPDLAEGEVDVLEQPLRRLAEKGERQVQVLRRHHLRHRQPLLHQHQVEAHRLGQRQGGEGADHRRARSTSSSTAGPIAATFAATPSAFGCMPSSCISASTSRTLRPLMPPRNELT